MTKDFKNPGLISQVAEFIDKKRIEEGISIDTLLPIGPHQQTYLHRL